MAKYTKEKTAAICNDLFRRAKDNRSKSGYDKQMSELDMYRNKDDESPSTISWSGARSFYVKTYKTEQFVREIRSRLITSNPRYRTSVKEWAEPGAQDRANISEGILNTAVTETDYMTDLRQSLDCGLGYGRGALRIGMNSRKNLPMVRFYPSKDIWTDPDATNWHQSKLLFIRNKSPAHDLAQRFPDMQHKIYDAAGDDHTGGGATGEKLPSASRMVTWIELYTLEGCERYQRGYMEKESRKQGKPTKYVFIEDGCMLYEGDWETPLYRETGRQQWPVEFLDFYDRDNTLYPDPPMRPGICWLRAYNYLQALIFLQSKRAGAAFLMFAKINGIELDQDSIDDMLEADFPLCKIDLSKAIDTVSGDNWDLRKYIQQFNFDSNITELNAAAENCLARFEEETGLYQFLYTGEPGTQDRSAAATHLRERNSRSRIDDYMNSFEEFLSRVGRKMSITARFHMDSEDVARYFGPEAAQAWGNLMTPEQMDPMFHITNMLQKDPSLPPEVASDVANDIVAQGVVFDKFLDETDFNVEGGSTKRKTPAEEQAGIEWLTNQLVPSLISSGAMRSAGMIAVKAAKLLGGLDDDAEQVMIEEFEQMFQQTQQQTMIDQQGAIMDQSPQQQ